MNSIFGWMDEVAVWLFMRGLQSRDTHNSMLELNANASHAWNRLNGQPANEYVEFSWLPDETPDWIRQEIGRKSELEWMQCRSPQAALWLRYQEARKNA